MDEKWYTLNTLIKFQQSNKGDHEELVLQRIFCYMKGQNQKAKNISESNQDIVHMAKDLPCCIAKILSDCRIVGCINGVGDFLDCNWGLPTEK